MATRSAGNVLGAAADCAEHDGEPVTLDARQHQIALALGARSIYPLG